MLGWTGLMGLSGCAAARPVAPPLPPVPVACKDSPTLAGGITRDCPDRRIEYMRMTDATMGPNLFKEVLTTAKQGKKFVDEDTISLKAGDQKIQATRLRFRGQDGGALQGEAVAFMNPQVEGVEIFACYAQGDNLNGIHHCGDDLASLRLEYPQFKNKPVQTLLLISALLGQSSDLPALCQGQDPTEEQGPGTITCGKNVLNWFHRTHSTTADEFLRQSDALEDQFKKQGATVQSVTQNCQLITHQEYSCRRWLLTLPDHSQLDALAGLVTIDNKTYLFTLSGVVPSPGTPAKTDAQLRDVFIWGLLGLWSA
jgi:hypothetical protein